MILWAVTLLAATGVLAENANRTSTNKTTVLVEKLRRQLMKDNYDYLPSEDELVTPALHEPTEIDDLAVDYNTSQGRTNTLAVDYNTSHGRTKSPDDKDPISDKPTHRYRVNNDTSYRDRAHDENTNSGRDNVNNVKGRHKHKVKYGNRAVESRAKSSKNDTIRLQTSRDYKVKSKLKANTAVTDQRLKGGFKKTGHKERVVKNNEKKKIDSEVKTTNKGKHHHKHKINDDYNTVDPKGKSTSSHTYVTNDDNVHDSDRSNEMYKIKNDDIITSVTQKYRNENDKSNEIHKNKNGELSMSDSQKHKNENGRSNEMNKSKNSELITSDTQKYENDNDRSNEMYKIKNGEILMSDSQKFRNKYDRSNEMYTIKTGEITSDNQNYKNGNDRSNEMYKINNDDTTVNNGQKHRNKNAEKTMNERGKSKNIKNSNHDEIIDDKNPISSAREESHYDKPKHYNIVNGIRDRNNYSRINDHDPKHYSDYQYDDRRDDEDYKKSWNQRQKYKSLSKLTATTEEEDAISPRRAEHVISRKDLLYYMDDNRMRRAGGGADDSRQSYEDDDDDGPPVDVNATTVKYRVIRVKSLHPNRRSGSPRRFIQEESPAGVALLALDDAPFPEFHLPRARRQYMRDRDSAEMD